jgi:ribonuclease HI
MDAREHAENNGEQQKIRRDMKIKIAERVHKERGGGADAAGAQHKARVAFLADQTFQDLPEQYREQSENGVFACETEHPEKEIFSISERIENTTNNTAEWTSLIEGIKKAREIGASKIQIFMDSELVVKQVKGEYKIKQPHLKALSVQAVSELKNITYTIQHIPREKNKKADALANLAFEKRK